MKNLKETTKKFKELSKLTKEEDKLLLKRVGSHLLRKLDTLQKKENKYNQKKKHSFSGVDYHPRRIRKITIIEVEVA